jgi:hypothetical protein
MIKQTCHTLKQNMQWQSLPTVTSVYPTGSLHNLSANNGSRGFDAEIGRGSRGQD